MKISGKEGEVIKIVSNILFSSHHSYIVDQKEIERFIFIRSCYRSIFSDSMFCDKDPIILQFEEKIFQRYFFIPTRSLQMRVALDQSDLFGSDFYKWGCVQFMSENTSLSNCAVSMLVNYLVDRESNYWRRKGRLNFDSFSNLLCARYYLVFLLCQTFYELSKHPLSNDLVIDYKKLVEFIALIQKNIPRYFQNTHQKGFHFTISSLIDVAQNLVKNTEYWIERRSIKDVLFQISFHCDAYIESIVSFLIRAVSPNRINQLISVDAIRKNCPIHEKNLSNLIVYKLIKKSLFDKSSGEVFSFILEEKDLPKELRHSSSIIVTNYDILLRLLFRFYGRSIFLRDLGQSIVKYGESGCLKDSLIRKIIELITINFKSFFSDFDVRLSAISREINSKILSAKKLTSQWCANALAAKESFDQISRIRSSALMLFDDLSTKLVLIDQQNDTEGDTFNSLMIQAVKDSLSDLKIGLFKGSQHDLFAYANRLNDSLPGALRIASGDSMLRNLLPKNLYDQLLPLHMPIDVTQEVYDYINLSKKMSSILDQVFNFIERFHSFQKSMHSGFVSNNISIFKSLYILISTVSFSNKQLRKFSDMDYFFSVLHAALSSSISRLREIQNYYLHQNNNRISKSSVDTLVAYLLNNYRKQQMRSLEFFAQHSVDKHIEIIDWMTKTFISSTDSLSLKDAEDIAQQLIILITVKNMSGHLRSILRFREILLKKSFSLRFFGGSRYYFSNASVLLPRNIVKILDYLDHVSTNDADHYDIDEINSNLCALFSRAKKGQWYYKYFSPRSTDTQSFYDFLDTFRASLPSHHNNSDGNQSVLK